jgi:catechol 2,3-dioxygenase-like lactoylglutathione lyase family enzyme
MIGYITIGAADIERAKIFYDSVLGTVGWKQFADYGDPVGYAQNETGEGQTIWICTPFDGAGARRQRHHGRFRCRNQRSGSRVSRRRDEGRWQR